MAGKLKISNKNAENIQDWTTMNGRHYSFNWVNIRSSIAGPWERKRLSKYSSCRTPHPFHIYIIHNHTKRYTVSNCAFNAFRNDAVKYEVAVRPKPVMWWNRTYCVIEQLYGPPCNYLHDITVAYAEISLNENIILQRWREFSALMYSALLISRTREPLIVAGQRTSHKGIHYGRARVAAEWLLYC